MILKQKRYVLTFLSLFFVFANLHAQTTTDQSGNGDIQGTVSDAVTGETLIGVNLRIQGTSLGTATNLSGDYIIRRVPAGTHTLIVSYIGFQRIEEEIEVESGETLELNFEMNQASLEGAEIVVSSQAEGQRRAINEQLSSRAITNVVSQEKIRELPDESAATALSRLPGVSLQEGDKVVIRGIQAKMNTVMVNGVQLPSTDLQDRSTNLGFISSNMLSGIEVTKAVTPNMDANSIGGVVNLRLMEAPEDWHFDVMTQGGYNTQDHTEDNYQVWASVSNRFFDNKVGAFFQVNARRENAGSDFSQANYNFIFDGSQIAPYGEEKMGMNSFTYGDEVRITGQRGGSLILDYLLPNGKLVLQNTYAYTDNNLSQHRNILDFSPQRRTYTMTRDIHNKQLIVNALQAEQDFNLFNIDFGFSHAFSKKDTDLRYGDPGDTFGFRNQDAEESPYLMDITRTYRLSMTPDSAYNLPLRFGDAEGARIIENGATRDEHFTERMFTGQLNVTVPVSISNKFSGEFQTGGSFRHTARENDVERTLSRISQDPNSANQLAADWMQENNIANPAQTLQFNDWHDSNYADERGKHFLGGLFTMSDVLNTSYMDTYMRLASPGWNRHLADSRRFDFDGTELLSAGYAMVDFQVGTRLELLGGVRYENHNMNYNSDFIVQTHGVDGDAVIPNDFEDPEDIRKVIADSLTSSDITLDHWFPNAQLRYKFADWVDLRLAYTKTLSRPDYSAIIPVIFKGSNNAGSAGNPLLKPSESTNYDAHLSFYSNRIGLFTVGGFYKKIENVFYSVNRLYRALPDDVIYPNTEIFDRMGSSINPNASNATITTWINNPNPAYLKGLEFDWQTHFWYLPSPFNNTVLNVNYTRVFSEMDYHQNLIETEFVCDPRCSPVTTERDTARTARLLHQGDHIINVALGADYKGFSGRLSFRMQGDVITSIGNRPEEDAFTGNIYGWDFTIRQRLPLEGLSLFVNGINIFHTPTKDYQNFRRDDDGPILTNLRQTSFSPRRFQLGIRFSY